VQGGNDDVPSPIVALRNGGYVLATLRDEQGQGAKAGSSGSDEVLLKISKSSRHSKITGDFAERLILYWLSKHGFECAFVDHTGLDIIAKHPDSPERMGISVKSRSRTPGTEGVSLTVGKGELTKLAKACESFGCVPYFAIVIDAGKRIHGWIVPKSKFEELCGGGAYLHWRMGDDRLKRYEADPEVKAFEFTTRTTTWW